MLYVFVPLYPEAKDIIDKLQLKKTSFVHGIDSFINDYVVLTITGVGKDNAVFSVASVLATQKICDYDHVIVFGSAMSVNVEDGLYIGNCLYDKVVDRYYYPDMIYDFGLEEMKIVTGSQIKYGSDDTEMYLYDMESTGMYFACSKHFGPHAITILRFVSDKGEVISRDNLIKKASLYTEKLMDIMHMLHIDTVDQEEDQEIIRLVEYLHPTRYQEYELYDLWHYAKIAHIDLSDVLDVIYHMDIVESKDRKKAMDAIREKCIRE